MKNEHRSQLDLDQPVGGVMQREFISLRGDMRIGEATESLRGRDLANTISYFYVTNEAGQLLGVLSTRVLLSAPAEALVQDVMQREVQFLPHDTFVRDACAEFLRTRFMA